LIKVADNGRRIGAACLLRPDAYPI